MLKTSFLAIHWPSIAQHISDCTHRRFVCTQQQAVGGGCINQACLISDGEQRFFVKLNQAALLPMFVSEAAGLQAMAATQTLDVPQVICYGMAKNHTYLVLSAFETGNNSRAAMRVFGQQLAMMHRHTQSQFGWSQNNTLGITPQINTLCDVWLDFWREQRLRFQLDLARQNGYGGQLQQQGQKLLADLDKFFVSYQPVASLLHGDLWAGNFAITSQGAPVLFDPATYYGDRETDMAMTELFGGFSADFYQAYQQTWPMDAGYQQRKPLYNLYHLLNHLNLFGSAYLGQSLRLIDRLANSRSFHLT